MLTEQLHGPPKLHGPTLDLLACQHFDVIVIKIKDEENRHRALTSNGGPVGGRCDVE